MVQGQRVEQKLSDISGSITVITEEDLERQIATELTDVFKNEPGVSVTGSAGRRKTSASAASVATGC